MKNYIIDGKDTSQYIQDVSRNANGTLSIVFADGRVFKNIIFCDENIEKIIAVQEEQAQKGIEKYRVFKGRERASFLKTMLSGIGVFAASSAATYIPVVSDALQSKSSLSIACGIGAITVLGTIPAYVKLSRERSRVEELDKLRYRSEHLEDLQNFRDYPNALVGVNPSVANWMRKEEDPFCILYIDKYELEDLEQIVSNIQIEKTYDFTYKKGKMRSR